MTGEPSLSLRVAGRLPRRIWIAAVLSLGFCILVITGGSEAIWMLWLAVWFGLFALVSLRRGSREVNLELNDDAVQLVESGQRIPLDDIEAILTRPRSASSGARAQALDATLVYRNGEVALPKFTPGRQEWLKALYQRMRTLDPLRGMATELRSFWHDEAAVFGSDAIVTARAVSRMPAVHISRGIITDSLIACLLTGLLLAILQPVIPALKPLDLTAAAPLAGVGAFWLFLIVLIKMSRRSALKRLGTAGAVVSPGGLALHYGSLKGVLRWHELSGFQLIYRGNSQMLRLRVPGSNILLTDVFDKPLQEIHGAISQYAGPPG